MTKPRNDHSIGIAMGVSAYGLWGVLPLYIRLLHPVSPLAILSHRVVWSAVLLAGLAIVLKRGPAARAALRRPRTALALGASTVMIACNWLLYIYAINQNYAIEASLGYFINPLFNVLMGVVFLRERLGRFEWLAIALAATGVAILAVDMGTVPYIPLGIALSFACYGLIRKMVGIGPVEGLLIETCLLAPFAMLRVLDPASLPADGAGPPYWLLMTAGLVTTVPLLLFAGAANRLPYSQLGLLQYMAPTLQFLIAVFAFGEPMLPIYAVTFGLIWLGLIVYVVAGWTAGG